MGRGPAIALSAPILAGIALLAVIVVSERASLGWLAEPDPQFNLAEVAGIGRAAPTLQRLLAGSDPNAVYAVRPGLLGNEDAVGLTPLEAAVMSGELEIVRLLDSRGARRDAALTTRLIAAATASGADDISEYLTATAPARR